MIRHTLALATLFAGALALAPELHAQDRPGRTDRGEERRNRAARVMARPGVPAEAALRMREALGLSADQVARLEALATSQHETRGPQTPDLLRARADLIEATTGEIDLGAARRALDRMAEIRTDAAMARLAAHKETRDVLTPEQRSRLDALRPGVGRRMTPGTPGIRRMQRMRTPRGPMGPQRLRRGSGAASGAEAPPAQPARTPSPEANERH